MCFYPEECPPPHKAESAEAPLTTTYEETGEATPFAVIWKGDEELKFY